MTSSKKSRRSVKKDLYIQEKNNKGTAGGLQGRGLQENDLKYLPVETDSILTVDYSDDYRMELLDRFVQISEPDEKLVNEIFRVFRKIDTVGIGDAIFVRRVDKWFTVRTCGGGGHYGNFLH